MLRRDPPVLDGLQNNHQLRQHRRLEFAYCHPFSHLVGRGGSWLCLGGLSEEELTRSFSEGFVGVAGQPSKISVEALNRLFLNIYILILPCHFALRQSIPITS